MVSTKKIITSCAALAVVFAGQAAIAADGGLVDSASLEAGGGSKVQMLRVAVQKDWDNRWFASNGYHLGGYWDANLAYWRGTRYKNVEGQHQNMAVIGITPVFRYQRDDKLGWYAEGGIGAALFSELYNNDDNRLSTAFQFADHLGAGYVFDNKWDIGAKIQHYSNGGIKHPNSGVNWFVVKATYRF